MSENLSSENALEEIRARIATAAKRANRAGDDVSLVAVSKTFEVEAIRPFLSAGQRVFGENRVQEAQGKWPQLREEFDGISLHLIGPLQSNKAGEAVALFDVIETVDREKIARALAREMRAQDKKPTLFVQVNTGLEAQKAGIAPKDTGAFVQFCREELDLCIAGLMCIPPFDQEPGPHFALLNKLAQENDVDHLSMGMSADFEIGVGLGATFVRVGSALFGGRKINAVAL